MKSQVNVDLELACNILMDAHAKCSTKTARDLKTLRSRVEKEGVSFLSLTLPSFLADFDRSLEERRIASSAFRSFKKVRAIPAFLQGMLKRVFDDATGLLLPNPCLSSIEGIRQIAGAFKKQKKLCSNNKIVAALDGFVKDEEIFDGPIPDNGEHFKSISDYLWSGLFHDYIDWNSSVPKHGPGATCEKISGNQKFVHKSWHDRLESYFPLIGNAFSSESVYPSADLDKVTIISEEQERPVRVIPVPKTQKSPRIIAIEPVCMQYCQQALSSYIISKLQNYKRTNGHINFRDQRINGSIAISASRNGKFATLDLSSASDRVPKDLALYMFRGNPVLMESIDACRSRRAILPDGRLVHLRKFASMGSALCFPVEAMFFYTICVGAILEAYGWPVTRKYVDQACRRVYVYGDDIIVPVNTVESVVCNLQKTYCKVNSSKSFWNGSFRESCGVDAYNGENVSITYIRQSAPRRRTDAKQIASWVSTSNQLYLKGYWKAADYMKNHVENCVGRLPLVKQTAPCLGWLSYQRKICVDRVSKSTQTPEVRSYVVTEPKMDDSINNYPALTKCLLSLNSRSVNGRDGNSVSDPTCTSETHLLESGRFGAVTLKRRWTPPF